jgi:hypothetical protein
LKGEDKKITTIAVKAPMVVSQLPIKFKGDSDSTLVVKSEHLAFAKNGLGLNDHKIFNAFISQINPKAEYPNGMSFILNRNQLAELTGIADKEVHRIAVPVAERLSKIQFLSRGRNSLTGEDEVEILNLIEKASYKNGELFIRMTETAEYHLVNLSRYGYFDIENQKEMVTKHGMGLLDMVSVKWHWKKGMTQDITLDLTDIKFVCDIIDYKGRVLKKSYDRFHDFKKRVLEPAIKDLNNTDEFTVNEIKYIKVGRSYSQIVLNCTRTKKFKNSKTDKNLPIKDRLIAHDIGQSNWANIYMMASVIQDAIKGKTDDEIIGDCLDYVEEKNEVQHFDKYFYEVLNLGVPFLPRWANPYGTFYKTEKVDVKNFVKKEIAPNAFAIISGQNDGCGIMSDLEFKELEVQGVYCSYYRPKLISYLRQRKES